MSRTTHRVAIVLLCEAEGLTEQDAADGATLALKHVFIEHGKTDDESQLLVGQVREGVCSYCGVNAGLASEHTVKDHLQGETWSLEELKADNPNEDFSGIENCSGSGHSPRKAVDPVVGFTRADKLPIYARIHKIIDAGTAIGNGYLWASPTWEGFK